MAWVRSVQTAEEVPPRSFAWGWLLFLIVAMLIVALMVTGIVNFRQTKDTTEIIIDREKLTESVDQAAEQGKKNLRDAGQELQRLEEDKPETPREVTD